MKTQIQKIENLNSLIESLKDDNFEKLSIQLAETCEYYADLILKRMLYLEVSTLEVEGIKTLRVDFRDKRKDFIFLMMNEETLNICKYSRGGGENGRWYKFAYNEFFYSYADNKEALYFLEHLKDYLLELKRIEDERSLKILKTLNELNNLNK